MDAGIISIVFSGVALVVSVAGYWLNYRMRLKDFQLAIMREQLSASQTLVQIVLDHNAEAKRDYEQKVVPVMQQYGMEEWPKTVVSNLNMSLLVKYSELHNKYYKLFLLQSVVLPDTIVDAGLNYFDRVGKMMENNDYMKTNDVIHFEFYDDLAELIAVIREEIGIDRLAEETRRLLSNHSLLKQSALSSKT